MASKAFQDAGRKARNTYSKSRLSKVPSALNSFVHDMREMLNEPEQSNHNHPQSYHQTDKETPVTAESLHKMTTATGVGKKSPTFKTIPETKIYKGRQRKKKMTNRPNSAPNASLRKRDGFSTQHLSKKKFDHRKDHQQKKPLRPRTPGALVYTIGKDGEYSREEVNVEAPKRNALSDWSQTFS